MKYLKICDTDMLHSDCRPVIRQVSTALGDYRALTGRDGFEPRFFRGQSRVHCEYDAIYMPVEDGFLELFLQKRGEFDGSWRLPGQVRVFEQMA